MENAMAPHSSTLAWKIPWMEEPGRLQSMGSLRVGHNWATSLSLFTFMHWRRKWQPTPVFLPENPRDGGAWWAAVYEVAQSRTLLNRLSSSSSIQSHVVSFQKHSVSYKQIKCPLKFRQSSLYDEQQYLWKASNTRAIVMPIFGKYNLLQWDQQG